MSRVAEVVLPAIRWDAARGFDAAMPGIEKALAAGVGGFIIFGGEREAVAALTGRLRAASRIPLLIGSDLERGAGQQFSGLTGLPPFGGLAAMGALATSETARITALEARDVGVNWIFSPCCDLDIEPDNPIVQTRAFSADPDAVGTLAAAWIAGCQAEGVLACAKHFPGHGRTRRDSHAELPVVDAGTAELEADLAPFRRSIAVGVAAVMSCHVAFPALGGAEPATYSRAILTDLLRGGLGHRGLVVTDALIMEGALGAVGPGASAVRAINAGCDLLLYPQDLDAVLGALEEAARDAEFAQRLDAGRVRRNDAARLARPAKRLEAARAAELSERGAVIARDAVAVLRGDLPVLRGPVAIEIVDDDAGGPYPLPPRDTFAAELERLGVAVCADAVERLVLLFADVKSWKGRAGLSAESQQRMAQLLATPATTVIFGHSRRVADVPGGGAVCCAWSGDAAMQRAVAQRLAGGR